MNSESTPSGAFPAPGQGGPLALDQSVAMRVASPRERLGRWLWRYRVVGVLLMLSAVFLGVQHLERSSLVLDQQLGGEAVRLESARQHLELASRLAGQDPKRAEVLIRRAIDLLQTLESPPPGDIAAALEDLATLLERRGEVESAYWMFEESRVLRVETVRGAGGPDRP